MCGNPVMSSVFCQTFAKTPIETDMMISYSWKFEELPRRVRFCTCFVVFFATVNEQTLRS